MEASRYAGDAAEEPSAKTKTADTATQPNKARMVRPPVFELGTATDGDFPRKIPLFLLAAIMEAYAFKHGFYNLGCLLNRSCGFTNISTFSAHAMHLESFLCFLTT
jgi:hypothetical protein